jgi:hypothetical protein
MNVTGKLKIQGLYRKSSIKVLILVYTEIKTVDKEGKNIEQL